MAISGVPLNKQELLQAIEKHQGIILHAAAELGCFAKTIYGWMERDEDVRKAINKARDLSLQDRIDRNEILKKKAYDSAEKLLDNEDVTQTIFTLKALCGWGEGIKEHSITINKIERPYNEKIDTNSSSIPV